ncbi:hypothetical protein [Cupriavidus necator]
MSARTHPGARRLNDPAIRRSVPWFIVMFVAASAANQWLPAMRT